MKSAAGFRQRIGELGSGPGGSSKRATAAAVAVVAIAACALTFRTIRNGVPAVDFSPLWLAGMMWNAGVDPYSASFVSWAHRFFPPPAHLPVSWVYPAQWMLPARLLGLIDYERAKTIWLIASLAELFGSIALLWRAAERLARPPSALVKAGAALFLLTMEATNGTLFLGQTGFLMLLGIALLLHGLGGDRPAEAAAGIVLLLLKPQFGIVVAAAALIVPRLRIATLAAIGITAVACLVGHAVSPLGIAQSIRSWLSAVGSYNDNAFNAPAALTGPILIDARLPMFDLSPLLYTGLAAIVAPLLVRWLIRERHLPAPEALALGAIISLAVIVPLHTYDLSFAGALLLLLPIFARPGQASLIAGLLLMHRARMVGGIMAPSSDILASQAIVATLGAALLLASLRMLRPRQDGAAS